MISHFEQPEVRRPKPVGHSCLLRIELDGPKPAIWRRLVVPTNANLGWLHAVFQISMGWTNSHLHLFQMGDKIIADPSFDEDRFEEEPESLDETKVRLGDLFTLTGETMIYRYDLGDSWHHLVTAEELPDIAATSGRKAICIEGERACPPEDCGGCDGYASLLEVLRDREHPEHKEKHEWLGRPFDPEHFLKSEINRWLGKLPWPRVTEAALRKTLMARFGE